MKRLEKIVLIACLLLTLGVWVSMIEAQSRKLIGRETAEGWSLIHNTETNTISLRVRSLDRGTLEELECEFEDFKALMDTLMNPDSYNDFDFNLIGRDYYVKPLLVMEYEGKLALSYHSVFSGKDFYIMPKNRPEILLKTIELYERKPKI